MSTEIGSAAGKIWEFLNTNGEASVNRISTETGLGKNEIQRAIGWLAKEDKLNFVNNGRVELLSLK